jgi:hypothetical protein
LRGSRSIDGRKENGKKRRMTEKENSNGQGEVQVEENYRRVRHLGRREN